MGEDAGSVVFLMSSNEAVLGVTMMPDDRFEFGEAHYPPETFDRRRVMEQFGLTEKEAKRQIERLKRQQVFRSSYYQVAVERIENMRKGGGSAPYLIELSIKRNDRGAIIDWRELQRIKNAIVGEESEAVQLFPAESRVVDTANQYWLYALPKGRRFGFGMKERLVRSATRAQAKQRPFHSCDFCHWYGSAPDWELVEQCESCKAKDAEQDRREEARGHGDEAKSKA